MPEFVGRDDALAAVVGALDRGPALVVVEGEPGIGKSRLVREALQAPGVRNRTVLVVACPPVAEPFPLGPVIDGLRRLHVDVGGIGLSALGGALRPLFPEWAAQLPPALEGLGDPKETRHRLLGALTELVERLGVGILVLEDAHWADTATLEWLLTHIAAEPAPRSVVVTYRPTDVPGGSLLPRLTSRVPTGMGHLRVELEPLDVADTRRLVESMLGADGVSEEFAAFLHERTDGLPLAVEESVRLLRERHDIIRQQGGWTRRVLDELKVPPTLRDSVLERVERLEPDARAILQAAAIITEPADEALLAAVADVDERASQSGVSAALVSGLLREITPGRYAFRHVLDSQAVESAIPVSERRRLHHRAAEVLKAGDHPSVARLARHYKEAGDTEAWCRYAEAAADLALESGDDRTAVVTLLDLLTTVEHPLERRVRLVHKLGDAAFFGVASLGELAHQVVDVLRAVLDATGLRQRDRGELRLHLGRMLWEVGEPLASFEEFEAAVPDLVDRPDLAIRAMTNLALPLISDWPASRHLKWLDRATELVQRSGSSSDQLAFAGMRATRLLLLGNEAGWTAAGEIPESASGRGEQQLMDRELLNVAQATMAWGRYEDTRRQLDVALGHIHSSGDQRRLGRARLAREYLDWYTGTWQGLGAAARVIVNSEEYEPVVQLDARQLLGLLDLVGGARAKAERQLRSVASEYEHLSIVQPDAVHAPAALGRLCLADGAADEALRVTASVMEMIERKGVWLWATDIASVHLDALIAAGNLGDAEEFVDQFAGGLAGRNAPAPATALLVSQAILAEARGALVESAGMFAGAASAWAALPRPYDELLALERQCLCLLAVGEQQHGLAVLSEAQQRLSDLGARWDADRVARVLRQHGVEVTRVWRRGRRGYGDQLSPRELEVVELVAQGMTNKQIAEVLFISPKTVNQHLSASMRKLNVSSRTALAMAASEAGLLSGG